MAGETPKCENPGDVSVNIAKIRSLVQGYIAKHQYQSAVFWADKAVSLSNGDVPDVYWYAQTLYLTGQYHRAENCLKLAKLDKDYAAGFFLAAKCLYECKDYKQALDVLDVTDTNFLGISGKPKTPVKKMQTHPLIPLDKIESSIQLLRGRVYEALANRSMACDCFRAALKEDVHCYEAFDALITHHMMTASEEKELIESLPFSKQCDEEEAELLKFLYENKLKKYHKPSDMVVPDHLSPLSTNIDVLVNLAERHYYNCNVWEAHKLTKEVLKRDVYNEACLPLHIAILVELKLSNDLFSMAHTLVLLYPKKAIAWFAVGCYYLAIGSNEPARRFLQKATSLERTYGPAWLAFGHGFAADNERDQAMAAYFTASQIMKGCHLPVLYIGLEYGLTNNAKLADRFFAQALEIAPEDPFVLHEMGVVAFQNQDYSLAEQRLTEALEKIQSLNTDVLADKWEPLLNNLAHTCRKLKKYKEALEYHRQALIIRPQNPTTLSGIGFVYALQGKYDNAIDYLHRALGLRRDDTFATTMLTYCIETHMAEAEPITGMTEGESYFNYNGTLESSHTELKAEDSMLDSSRGQDTSNLLEESSGLESEDQNVSMSMDSSGMALDTDMEDA